MGEQGHSKPWEVEDNSGVLGSRFQAALATRTDARERIKRCSCLLVSPEQKSLFASTVDAKSSGPEQGHDELRRGLARSHVLQNSQAFCLKAFLVKRETANCGIPLSIRGEPASSPSGPRAECPPCSPVPGPRSQAGPLFCHPTHMLPFPNLIAGDFSLSSVPHISN